jgi:hypothetical protein
MRERVAASLLSAGRVSGFCHSASACADSTHVEGT